MQAIRRSWRTWCTLLSVSLVIVAGISLFFPPSGVGHEGPDEEHVAIAQPQNVSELHIALGLTDEEQSVWEGDVQVSAGKLIKLEIIQASRDSTVEGSKFRVRPAQAAGKKKAGQKKAKQTDQPQKAAKQEKKKKKKQAQAAADVALVPARVRAILDAPANARITVNTSQGNFSFALAELMLGSEQTFLENRASVRRQAGALPLTGKSTEDDYPAFARGKDGRLWLAYVAYQPGPELVTERVLAGNFESLESRSGEQIRLVGFDGKTWQPLPPATENGMEVWRPTVAVDGEGYVHVAWAQKLNDDWNILTRRFKPAKQVGGEWGEIHVVTDAKGSDFDVVATTDAKGKVWLAWQGWRGDNYDIMLTTTHPTAGWDEPKRLSQSKANDWSPTIAADSQGRVFVAWDTYDKENYDVVMREAGSNSPLVHVANSAQFEARPNLYCDAKDRLWIAYEEGNEQWGKDYASENGFRNVGLADNPGFGLYVDRTVKVRCLENDKLLQPAGELASAMSQQLTRNKSLPRLMGDSAGGLWLLLRHHPLPGGAGEAWHSYALRYSGKQWSEPKQIPSSSNLLDNRPALAPFDKGIVVVLSSDSRTNTAGRGRNDLYASALVDDTNAAPPELVAVPENTPAKLASVHENELDVVKKLRELRVSAGGKDLRLVRGEFHRHTEFTAHRDQDGLLEDSWRYALDAGKLDWMGNGDHDNGGGHEYMWWIIQKQCDLHHNPPHFVAAMTYERSNQYPNGHRNVMMPRRGIRPLPRGQLQGTPEEGTPDTKILYAYLKHFGGICASHTSATNMGTDWRDNDPEVEPVVEIYQGHRHNYEHFGAPRSPTAETQIGGYQPAGFVWNALEKGYKLGFQSSSDHVSTHMSYAGVLATDNTRQAIIDAFKKRHSYGATDNILLIVRSGEQLMGDVFTTKEYPKISIQAVGGKPIAKVSIVRDNKYVYANEPMTPEVRRDYTDMDVKPGETHYYYVRAEQSDGNLAWASPMWITYQP
jgi:hypothetical protein